MAVAVALGTVGVVFAAPLPDVARTFVEAWQVLSRSWVSLLGVSVAGWLPFGVLVWVWVAWGVDVEAVGVLLSGSWEGQLGVGSLVADSGVFVAGLVVVPLLWVLSTCWVNGASAVVAHGVRSGVGVSVGSALGVSARKLHRTFVVYVAVVGVGVLLLLVSVVAGVGVWVLLDGVVPLLVAGVVSSLVVVLLGVAAVGVLLVLYARWAVALQAAVLDGPGSGGPLASSARLTRGRRVGVLGRVLLLSLAVALVAGVVSSVFAVGSLGPLWLLLGALLGRVLVSFVSGAGVSASVTVVYDGLAGS